MNHQDQICIYCKNSYKRVSSHYDSCRIRRDILHTQELEALIKLKKIKRDIKQATKTQIILSIPTPVPTPASSPVSAYKLEAETILSPNRFTCNESIFVQPIQPAQPVQPIIHNHYYQDNRQCNQYQYNHYQDNRKYNIQYTESFKTDISKRIAVLETKAYSIIDLWSDIYSGKEAADFIIKQIRFELSNNTDFPLIPILDKGSIEGLIEINPEGNVNEIQTATFRRIDIMFKRSKQRLYQKVSLTDNEREQIEYDFPQRK